VSSQETGRVRLLDLDWLPLETRRQKIVDLYLFAVDACLRGGADRWWQRTFAYDQASNPGQDIASLKDFCLNHLLYEAGDIPALRRIYEILDEEGHLEGDVQGRFLLALTRYLDQALRLINRPLDHTDQDERLDGTRSLGRWKRDVGRALRDVERRVTPQNVARSALVSVVILDGVALTNFHEFCMPSLAAAGGLKALGWVRAATLRIYGRERDLPDIELRLKARDLNCTIVYQPIPEDIAVLAEGVGGPQKDWLTGALQCLHLLEARRRGADFHSINPNAVYPETFFEEILRLEEAGEQAVLLAPIHADREAMRGELAPFARQATLEVPAGELVSAALRTIAPAGVTVLKDFGHFGGGETSHLQLMWEGRDCVRLHTTHHEIAFLSRSVLDRLPPKFFVQPTAEVDRIIAPDVRPHFVGESDRLALVDLGGTKTTIDGQGMDFGEFGSVVLSSTRPRQGEYFREAVRFAVARATCPERAWRDDAEIAQEDGAVLRALDEPRTWFAPSASQALTALNGLHQYEASEYGRENLAGVIGEGRRILDIIRTDDSAIEEGTRKELIRAALNFDYVDKAVALAGRGQAGTAFIHDFLARMMELKAANAARARDMRPGLFRRSFAVVGSIAWGEAFVDKFMNYCLPSLLAPGNIPALARRKRVVHSIVTTEADRDRMIAHPIFPRLKAVAEVVFTCFPAELLAERERAGYNFYYFYGLLDHQSVFLAQALKADLYLLPVDVVYSRDSLKHLSLRLARDADCCSVAGIECEPDPLRAWLDARPRDGDGVLDLDPVEVLQAGCTLPDAYCRSLVMSPENNAFCRHPRELLWPLPNGIAIHSIFMHPVAVSARMMARPFHPQHENVDFALLPRLLQDDGRMRIIDDARQVAIAQFGAPVGREEYLDTGFSIKSFLEAHRYDYAVQRQCFATRQFFSCEDAPYPTSDSYAAELAIIQKALVRNRFRA
jgi:hypothetical protein